ncbi:MAG: 2OG-Fe(II) oxygenase [Alphaproteobacteria bacterium]
MTNFTKLGITTPVIATPNAPNIPMVPSATPAKALLDQQRAADDKGENLGFERKRTIPRIFNDQELDGLIAVGEAHAQPASISGGKNDDKIRRSEVVWLRRSEGYDWVYDRIWTAIDRLNAEFFHFDITGFQTSVQLTRYAATNRGHYTWHMDNGDKNATRKLSFTVQVSDPDAYRGGDLELFYKARSEVASRDRGSITVFPSFVMHRVSPVKKGTRYSLVAWIEGPRWR